MWIWQQYGTFPSLMKKFRCSGIKTELTYFYVRYSARQDLNFELLRVSASHWMKRFKSLQVILSLAHFVKSESRIALKSPVEPKKYHQAIFSIHTCRGFLQHQKSIAVFTTVFQGLKYVSLIRYVTMYASFFENYLKCRI